MSETSPITEQANPETELARDRCSPEDLPPDALQTIPRTEPVVQVSEQINAELENLSVGAGRTQVEEDEEEEDVVNDSGRLVQPDAGGSSSGGLKRIPPSMTRGFPLPVSYLPVGQAFEDNRKMIWSWLMNDEISTIGICGKRGIGKSTILKHIHNELLQRPDISRHVYWVTVSQDLSIYRFQNLIARYLDLDLSSEYDILPRAAKLTEELMKKQEWILILDGLWESFELSTVGIPVPLKKGCKVILTTRSNAICQRMGSQVITKVTPLSEREAWDLFMEKLGHGIALSPEVERIAVDIVRECAGLPLGIITMAGSLRGVDDEDEWRNTLEELKGSKSRDIEDEVFRMLRFSYDRLDDKLQQSLLYCASFPEGHEIEREELIFYLIDGAIIENMWSREAAFEKGHAMLDTLENAVLLERIAGGLAVKMHDLVRDMAIRICKENPSVKRQRRKRIEMAPLKSGWTGAVSASAREQNNVDMAQQREPLLTGEFERANDLTAAGIELPPDTPDDRVAQPGAGASSSGGLRHNRSETRGAPLLTGSTRQPISNISPNGRFRRVFTYWEKGELLGRGSFGSVYEGISDDGLFFAVKEVSLLDQGTQGKQSIYQLEQEIALLSRFEHENIVQYYGTDKDESKLYIFLELVTKGSLQKLYQRYNLRDSQVSSYTRQILHGLKYLHDQKVVHRDIKCANLLVDANGSVKLADFGLAKATKLNDVKSCKGTAFWMAPEVVNNKNQGYGLSADIWSLGCTVLEMLTRQIPYSELESMQALFRIGRGFPPLVPDSLSNDARDFILQCLQVNPNDRPTAAVLLDHPFVKKLLSTSSGSASPYIGRRS